VKKNTLEERIAELAADPIGCIWPFVLVLWLAVLWVKFVQGLKERRDRSN
jgi:hypothetical protein